MASTSSSPAAASPPSTTTASTRNISCFLRVRPAKPNEQNDLLQIQPDNKSVTLNDAGSKSYPLDWVFDNNSNAPGNTNADIFQRAIIPIVDNALDGNVGSFLSYGQCGGGKSYTLCNATQGNEGLVPLSVRHIFQRMQIDNSRMYTVKFSYLQIYLDNFQDLLNPDKNENSNIQTGRDPKDGSLTFTNITERQINSEADFQTQFATGNQYRVITATALNREANRSHTVGILTIESKDLTSNQTRKGKLMFFDLAGYERFTGTTVPQQSQFVNEAKSINASLLSLGNVIEALSTGANLVPFRNSKLTTVFQNALISHTSKCAFIVCVGPSKQFLHETLGSLYFASRAMTVRIKAPPTKAAVSSRLATGSKKQ